MIRVEETIAVRIPGIGKRSLFGACARRIRRSSRCQWPALTSRCSLLGSPCSRGKRVMSCVPFLMIAALGAHGFAEQEKPEPRFRNGKLVIFKVAERPAYLIVPQGNVDGQRRWIWIAPSWLGDRLSGGAGAGKDEVSHQYYVDAALAKGFHVAGV